MIKIKTGNIFETECSTIVNAVNCVGVMGKGIALEFKKRYPDMFNEYVKLCRDGQVEPNKPYVYFDKSGIKILNFPTKNHWRTKSKLSYIVDGLDWFVENYLGYGIESIAFPALGCGNGGLSWKEVYSTMNEKLKPLPIYIEIYSPINVK